MRPTPRSTSRGFTLIELMIVIAIVAILAAIALPSYRDYVMRGYVVDATTLLSTTQTQMERYYQDNRTYQSATANGTTVYPPCDTHNAAALRTQGNFVITCSAGPTATAYTLQATGSGPVASFNYFVDNAGTKSSSFPTTATGWTSSTTCWVVKKGQTC